jgi:FlaA1/EpsC-like NDP-sugar epimerase
MIRNRYLLAADLPLIALAVFGAFAIRFDLRFIDNRPEFAPYLLVAVLLKPCVYYACGMYRRVWRYAGVHDLFAVTVAVTAASALMAVVATAFDPMTGVSRAVLVVDWLLSIAFVGGARISVRLLSEHPWGGPTALRPDSGRDRRQKRLLIVGAGDAGAVVAREIQRSARFGLAFVGFLDDEAAKQGKWIHGVQVLAPIASLDEVMVTQRIDEVLIALPSATGPVLRAIAESCRKAGVVSRTMPSVLELVGGQVSVNRLRNLEITDLLRREPVDGEVDCGPYLRSRRVLVTGAGGSIGRELCRQVAQARPERLILLGHGENSLFEARVGLQEMFPDAAIEVVLADVRDRDRLNRAFRIHRPDVVFHAAAHKHVPMMEENPEEAVTNNVVGTRNVVEAALAVGVARLVMISTDKAVAPSSIMGASKRLSEMIVRDAAIRHNVPFVVVRFGNVLGSRGSVVPHFQRQIGQGGPITITHPEVKRFFMTIPEAVHLVLQSGALATCGDLFVLDMGEPVRIVDLARDMIKLSTGADENISIVFTGLRRGEKLEEALWEPDARVDTTAHPHVLRVSEPYGCAGAELAHAVERLVAAAGDGDRLAIEHEFAQIVTSYVPASV